MINEITLASQASYSGAGESLADLKSINFIFGTNGSGKTTISRVIADPAAYPSCNVVWDDGRQLECLVYNVDFIRRNFADQMPGIFTLGQDAGETVDKIREARQRISDLEGALVTIETALRGADGNGGKHGELTAQRTRLEESCWRVKQRYDADFSTAFEGYRGAKPKFCEKVLAEQQNNNADLKPIDDLKTRASTIFDKSIAKIDPLPLLTVDDLVSLESDPILSKRIVGKDDVDIAGLINRLGSSDWVKEGVPFLEAARPLCPFCQQDAPSDLEGKLAAYFDETFVRDIEAIESVQSRYETFSDAAISRLARMVDGANRYLNEDAFRAEMERFSDRVEANKRALERKRKEPSTSVVLDTLQEVADAITTLLTAANEKTAAHNQTVDNLATEKAALSKQIWKYVVNECSAGLDEYDKQTFDIQKAITGLDTAKEAKTSDLRNVQADLHELEKRITSVQPTVSAINAILGSFGFTNFKLATAGEKGSLYEIVRPDGSKAAETLSEGERSFITFLYFFHLLRGSMSPSGTTNERVVVFDDPVSSLDSDVLFIVSSLIKRTLEEACKGDTAIKQVFVLTHNIYFHKEVAFDAKRGKECRSHETFWIIRKLNERSEVVGYPYNPIKTSYELLWGEVRDQDRSKLTIQNTLRRILENYFKILGNLDKDDIVGKFEGRDQQICASLFSWVNDGSHGVYEDLYVSADAELIERYLDVFRRIFEKTGHIGHYRMMMGIEVPEREEDVDGEAATA